LVEQATRRPAELQQAMQAGTNVLDQQWRVQNQQAEGAANVLGNTDYSGDWAAIGLGMGGGTPQINISRSNQGIIGSRFGVNQR
jgi:hypothetical protein